MKDEFKDYKEKQKYYNEKYKNRGEVIWVSKVVDKKTGKILKFGATYRKGE